MTPLNTIIEEEKKAFDERFSVVTLKGETHICDFENQETIDLYEPIKDFLTTAMQRAYEAGAREAVNYLRNTFKDDSEIGVNHLNVELNTLLSKITHKTPTP